MKHRLARNAEHASSHLRCPAPNDSFMLTMDIPCRLPRCWCTCNVISRCHGNGATLEGATYGASSHTLPPWMQFLGCWMRWLIWPYNFLCPAGAWHCVFGLFHWLRRPSVCPSISHRLAHSLLDYQVALSVAQHRQRQCVAQQKVAR